MTGPTDRVPGEQDMGIVYEQRSSESPYVESITHGHTAGDGSTIRPAESRWHMVVARQEGDARMLVVGPLTTSGVASWAGGAEILWVRFGLGTFMPHLPVMNSLDREMVLPGATDRSFWLGGSAWKFPDHENVETFVERLVRDGLLVRDPIVNAALKGGPQVLSPRTLRHRFLRATGLPQSRVLGIERAGRAAALLRRGVSISDAIHEEGYFDQPHLTRSLKRWVGHTPAQIVAESKPYSVAQVG